MSSYPKVFLLTVNWNGLANTLDWLASVKQSSYKPLEIVVVDNNSFASEASELKNKYPEIQVLENSSNLGATGGFNTGIRYAIEHGADFIFIANNDTRLHPECIAQLVAFCAQKPKAGIVVPKIYLTGTTKFYTAGAPSIYNFLGTVGYGMEDRGQHNAARQIDWTLSTGMLVRREVFEQAGLLDEDYFIYYEDFEFSRRVLGCGYELWYCPEALMWHKPKQSTGWFSKLFFYYSLRNLLLTIKKIQAPLLWKLLACISIPFRLLFSFVASVFNLDFGLFGASLKALMDFSKGKFGKGEY